MPRPVVLAVLAAVALGGAAAILQARAPAHIPVAAIVEESPSATPLPAVIVDVEGAVLRPGVVRLVFGARVGDAIAAAGGATPGADTTSLNRAALLRDGARVYVPRAGESPPAGSLGSAAEAKVDLNRASTAELQTLPGVGPTTANRIVRSRDARPFGKIEELQTRGLVSTRVFAEIRDLLTLR